MQIQVGRASQANIAWHDIRAMHRLRYEVFRKRLQWDVECQNESESDVFDTPEATYMLVKNDANEVCGCWRMLPTTGPYMMKDTFAQTLCGHEPPQDPRIWELSRFALSRHEGAAHRFSATAVLMMERAIEFGLEQGITQFCTVTTVAIERLLKGMNLTMQRYGAPMQIGIEKTVAFTIEVSEETLDRLRDRRLPSSAGARLAA